MLRWGYEPEDARSYTVAACWEFIIPGKGMDIPNIEAVSFPKIVNRCAEKYLADTDSMEQFCEMFLRELKAEVDSITEKVDSVFMFPAPYLSMLMEGCAENLRDICEGGIYNNYGLHGTGIACAADSLYALEKFYYEDRRISADQLVHAVQEDFSGEEDYLKLVREEMHHMGDGDPEVDKYGIWLLDTFAKEVEGRKNKLGGIYRAGTGSAMYYIRHAEELGASPDGRRKGEYFPANYSPGLSVKTKGPLSVIKSFTAPDLSKAANGGPLTLEFHDSVFRGEDGIKKVAALVQLFVKNGGHQLQLNAINAGTLKDAQKNPENYRNLIVRVWGWSAYFVELDKVYQDHLIRRAEYTV
ncbi:pyruvate formate lyase family protein [Faecalicatena contorta]|uniref:pyruvate formate lyase family protein n=1 Tax=Faecalicatena contorta TaxID=39482 RepID=UPI0023EA8D3D|nr:pyruvate formate lyase family protein [Faecalicatena contorta]